MNLQRRLTKSEIVISDNLNGVMHIDRDILNKKYLSHDDVRIYPSIVVMENAFEMKEFKEKIVIQNCGHKKANIRLFSPNSNNFRLMTIPGGMDLAPGMQIVRYITHKYKAQTSLTTVDFPIFINEHLINYQVVVTIPQAKVCAENMIIDFGIVDIGETGKRPLILKNQGHSQAFFIVDVVNDLVLQTNVTPKKGTIDALEHMELQVEISGTKEGKFVHEFWIKTQPLLKIEVNAEIIIPGLKPMHPLTDYNITVIDFPKTYFGSSCTKTLVVQNISSLSSMFCCLVELDGELLEMGDARNREYSYNFFELDYMGGRLQPFGSTIIQIRFEPYKTPYFKKKQAFGFIKLIKVMFRDYTAKDVSSFLQEEPLPKPMIFRDASVDVIQSQMEDSDDEPENVQALLPDFFRISFHGEIEEVSVKIRPETIHLRGEIGRSYQHEIYLKNENKSLPIWYKIEKVAFIDVEPRSGKLGSDEAHEILMTIKPRQMGECKVKVKFELLYPKEPLRDCIDVLGQMYVDVCIFGSADVSARKNRYVQGITPMVTNEVGYLEKPVTFAMVEELPMKAVVYRKKPTVDLDNLVSVPNDRPRSMRPWRNPQRCATIFTNLPRYKSPDDKYNFTSEELQVRNDNRQYYLNLFSQFHAERENLIRRLNQNLNRSDDYVVTFKKHVMLEDLKCLKGCYKPKVSDQMLYPISLPPRFLINIIINPRVIYLGKMTSDSRRPTFFEIENINSIGVDIFLKPSKRCILIKDTRFNIRPNSKIRCDFTFTATGINICTAYVAVLLNSCHITEVNVSAKIVTPILICDVNDITMKPWETMHFITLINRVDTSLDFSWQLSSTRNYFICPKQGKVPPKKQLKSALLFHNKVDSSNDLELLLSSPFNEHTIIVRHEPRQVQVEFSSQEIQFGVIPTNVLVYKQLHIRNTSDNSVTFTIVNPVPVFGIQIKPTEGLIKPNSTRIIYLNAKFRQPGQFAKKLHFTFEQNYRYSVKLIGAVNYPEVVISPTKIHTHKLVPQAKTYYEFSLENISKVDAYIKFLLLDLKEFAVQNENRVTIRELTLVPGEKRHLLIKFAPTEAVAYSIYLPIQINHVFGPPRFNVEESLDPQSYLSARTSIDGFKQLPLPSSLPILFLSCAAGHHLIKFSKLHIKFNKNEGYVSEDVTMTNLSDKKIRMIIDLSPLTSTFEMEFISGPRKQDYDKTVFIRFAPNDVVIYRIKFVETTYGGYEIKLPIYIKEYFDNCLFNHLTLGGIYNKPIITTYKRYIYFEPLLPGETQGIECDCVLNYHNQDCTVYYEPSVEYLEVTTETDNLTQYYSKAGTTRITAILTFKPEKECIMDTMIMLTCTCGAETELIVRGVAESCAATAYLRYFKAQTDDISLLSQKTGYTVEHYALSRTSVSANDVENFPYFPITGCSKNFLGTKIRIQALVESWLYQQGFFCRHFYKLPFAIRCFSWFPNGHRKKKNPKLLPIQELMLNLCGDVFKKQLSINLKLDENDPVSVTIYSYTYYKNLLEFLKVRGMSAPHISAQILISYSQYLIFKDRLLDHEADDLGHMIQNESYFNALAAQAWLDLILQIYKIFVLSKVTLEAKFLDEDFMRYYDQGVASLKNTCKEESILLMWLEYTYVNNHKRIFKGSAHKTLTYFGQDLNDGLVLAVLVVTYCPYMENHLSQIIYNCGNELEIIFSNACVLIESFKILGLCFYVDPIDIVYPAALEMLLLTNYLFCVLPNLSPKQTITMEARLGGTSKEEITITNPSPYTVCYKNILIPNNSSFTVEPTTVIVPSGSHKQITITYKARKVSCCTATLILSGDTPKYKFAESLAYTLLGEPLTNFCNPVFHQAILYQPKILKIPIVSPYVDYTCEIFTSMIKSPKEFSDFISWKNWETLKFPRQFWSDQTSCTFDANGKTTLHLNVCYISPGVKEVILFFLHDNGDFCVDLAVNVRDDTELVETLTTTVPFTLAQVPCVCFKEEIKDRCPRTIILPIPCKNSKLWDGLMVLLETSRPLEVTFWRKYLKFPIGIKILKLIMFSSIFWEFESFDEIFGKNINFIVKTSKRLKSQQEIVIGDVRSDDSFNLTVHWNRNVVPDEEFITLMATHKKENRYYRVLFFDNRKRISDVRI